jgi:hypothetical protein
MRHIIIADASTGEIRFQVQTNIPLESRPAESFASPGCVAVETIGEAQEPDSWRVVDGELVPRTVMAPSVSKASILPNGEDVCAISGLPDPCIVTIAGAVTAGPVEITGGVLELTSTHAGAIEIEVRAGLVYSPWRTTINAT